MLFFFFYCCFSSEEGAFWRGEKPLGKGLAFMEGTFHSSLFGFLLVVADNRDLDVSQKGFGKVERNKTRKGRQKKKGPARKRRKKRGYL